MPRDFKLLMVTRFLFTFGVQMQAVILGWHMYELTKDPLFLGFIGLAEAVPAIGLSLFAGYVVDHGRPLLIYRLVILTSFISGLILLLTQLPQVHDGFLTGTTAQVIALFASSVMTGLARSFAQPAMFSIVPKIVPRADLPRSSAWMSTAMQIARISGPAIGGIIFGWMGILVSAAVICVVLLIAQAILALIKTKIPKPERPTVKESAKVALMAGAKFVFNHKVMFPALSLDMVCVFFGGVTALLPIYASEILMVGPKGLGALRASPAIGAALMAFVLTKADIREKAGKWLFVGVIGFGLSILVFAISKNLFLSIAALGFSGFFDGLSMIIRTSIVQLSSPDAMRGRISAVNSIFIGSSNELGELESGVAAKLLGTIPAAIFGACVCLLTVTGVAYFSRSLRELDLKKLSES